MSWASAGPTARSPVSTRCLRLAQAAIDVARAYGLADDWLNLGPASLLDGPLPAGFAERLSQVAFGALRLWIAGREDLVALKLWAAADRWPGGLDTASGPVVRLSGAPRGRACAARRGEGRR
jgi:hypothetical protein